jgi:two-component system, OmpR family, response regulator MtrA
VDPTILVIEDDPSIRELTQLGLSAAGFTVSTAADGWSGLTRFRQDGPDLVVLDLMLPGLDGLEVCRQIRAVSVVPIVMLTARTDTSSVVVGLEAGADDYVTKPFEMPVLVARVRAALRRVQFTMEELALGPVRVDLAGHTVRRDGEEVPLTATEFRLLCVLASAPGRVLTRQVLLDQVWGYDYLGDSRMVDVAVQRLRAKIEGDPAHPELIQTVRSVGYRAAR